MTKKTKQERKELRKTLHQQKKREEDNHDLSHLVPNTAVSEYEISDNKVLRKVSPYYFTHTAFAKQRWLGKTIFQTFMDEFLYSEDEAKKRFEGGYVCVNGNPVTADYVIKDLDKMEHRIHRHELPVLNDPITVVHEDENLLVVNKPASIPIHPCGRYLLNSLIYILAKEYHFIGLHIVHRLDRMTSGLVIFSKKYDTTQKLVQSITGRRVKKYYLARVRGKFPSVDTSPIEIDQQNYISVKQEKSYIVECRAPLGHLSPKLGIHFVRNPANGGKDCYTQFMRLCYLEDDCTSLVLCRIHTGRTHQIRIHLQYLGYPISNDPIYSTLAWGPKCGRHGEYNKTMTELVDALTLEHSAVQWNEDNYEPQVKRNRIECSNDNSSFKDPDCSDCVKNRIKDPPPESLVLYLHAQRYIFEEWDFCSPLPKWAPIDLLPIDYSCLEHSSDHKEKETNS